MATRPHTGGWWTVEHAGAPRWLIVFAFLVFVVCGIAVVFNGSENGGANEGIAVNSPSPTPRAGDSSPSSEPSASEEPLTPPSESAAPSVSASAEPSASSSPSTTPLVQGPPRVAFIGDSYVSGIGATTPSARWTSIVSTRLGWSEFNFGVPGTGYLTSVTENAIAVCGAASCPSYQEILPQVQAVDPDVVVISGGRNDIDPSATRQDRVAAALRTSQAVEGTLAAVRSALPDTEIIVVSPLWDDEIATPSFRAYRASVRSAVEDSGATYLDVGEPLAARTDRVARDGIHPNDAGYLAIADAFGTPAIPAP